MKSALHLTAKAIARSPLKIAVPLVVAVMTLVIASLLDRPASNSMQGTSTIQTALLVWLPVVLMFAYLHGRRLEISSTHLGYAGDPVSIARFRLPIFMAATIWCLIGWFSIMLAGAIGLARLGVPTLWVMAFNAIAMILIVCAVGTLLAVARVPVWLAVVFAIAVYAGVVVWNYLPYQAASILFSVYGSVFFSSALPSQAYLLIQFVWALLIVGITSAVLVQRRSIFLTFVIVCALATGTVFAGSQVPYLTSRSDVIPIACHEEKGINVCLWQDVESGRQHVNEGVRLAASLVEHSRLATFVVSSDFDDRIPHSIPPDSRIVRIPVHQAPDSTGVAIQLVLDALIDFDCDDRNLGEIATAIRTRTIPRFGDETEQASVQELREWITSECGFQANL